MSFPESLLNMAGFAFAHAAWSVSDLPLGELLVPLAIVEKDGQRQLLRFEAETQEQAIAEGKAALAEHEAELDAWVFVREGQLAENDTYVSVLTVEAKAQGAVSSLVFIQRFEPFASGRFKLLGQPWVSVGGTALDDNDSKRLTALLLQGVQSHAQAASQWSEWAER